MTALAAASSEVSLREIADRMAVRRLVDLYARYADGQRTTLGGYDRRQATVGRGYERWQQMVDRGCECQRVADAPGITGARPGTA
jgi:hypothetical protein